MVKKILLVDDVRFFIELEKNYLSVVDCEIYTASDGKEALEVACEQIPDLVLLDYEMPVMSGIEFIKEAKKNEKLKDIPIVVVSSFVDDELENNLRKNGVSHILKKPFTEDKFIQCVKEFLQLDKRKRERIKVDIPAFYGFEDKMEKGIILDISEGGAFLSATVNLKEGAVLEIKFLVPNTNQMIKTWAKIIWINSENNKKKERYPAGMGLEFIGISKEHMQILRNFIKEANK